jgi:hypothetical protein
MPAENQLTVPVSRRFRCFLRYGFAKRKYCRGPAGTTIWLLFVEDKAIQLVAGRFVLYCNMYPAALVGQLSNRFGG